MRLTTSLCSLSLFLIMTALVLASPGTGRGARATPKRKLPVNQRAMRHPRMNTGRSPDDAPRPGAGLGRSLLAMEKLDREVMATHPVIGVARAFVARGWGEEVARAIRESTPEAHRETLLRAAGVARTSSARVHELGVGPSAALDHVQLRALGGNRTVRAEVLRSELRAGRPEAFEASDASLSFGIKGRSIVSLLREPSALSRIVSALPGQRERVQQGVLRELAPELRAHGPEWHIGFMRLWARALATGAAEDHGLIPHYVASVMTSELVADRGVSQALLLLMAEGVKGNKGVPYYSAEAKLTDGTTVGEHPVFMKMASARHWITQEGMGTPMPTHELPTLMEPGPLSRTTTAPTVEAWQRMNRHDPERYEVSDPFLRAHFAEMFPGRILANDREGAFLLVARAAELGVPEAKAVAEAWLQRSHITWLEPEYVMPIARMARAVGRPLEEVRLSLPNSRGTTLAIELERVAPAKTRLSIEPGLRAFRPGGAGGSENEKVAALETMLAPRNGVDLHKLVAGVLERDGQGGVARIDFDRLDGTGRARLLDALFQDHHPGVAALMAGLFVTGKALEGALRSRFDAMGFPWHMAKPWSEWPAQIDALGPAARKEVLGPMADARTASFPFLEVRLPLDGGHIHVPEGRDALGVARALLDHAAALPESSSSRRMIRSSVLATLGESRDLRQSLPHTIHNGRWRVLYPELAAEVDRAVAEVRRTSGEAREKATAELTSIISGASQKVIPAILVADAMEALGEV